MEPIQDTQASSSDIHLIEDIKLNATIVDNNESQNEHVVEGSNNDVTSLDDQKQRDNSFLGQGRAAEKIWKTQQ